MEPVEQLVELEERLLSGGKVVIQNCMWMITCIEGFIHAAEALDVERTGKASGLPLTRSTDSTKFLRAAIQKVRVDFLELYEILHASPKDGSRVNYSSHANFQQHIDKVHKVVHLATSLLETAEEILHKFKRIKSNAAEGVKAKPESAPQPHRLLLIGIKGEVADMKECFQDLKDAFGFTIEDEKEAQEICKRAENKARSISSSKVAEASGIPDAESLLTVGDEDKKPSYWCCC